MGGTWTVSDIAVLLNWIQSLEMLPPPHTHIYPDVSTVVGFSGPGKDLVCFGQMENKKSNKGRVLACSWGPLCTSYGCLALYHCCLFTSSPP